MTLEIIRNAFGWCAIINSALLVFWLIMLIAGRGFVYRMHHRFFPMPEERFIAIHYSGMAAFKLFIIAANITPYLALRIVG
ncbi:DUF6868 family protein [Haloferula sp.]|uniref:DUF6868 family protein n=1 Tax=Haloferula sp. TaxID=2497595 RepID=UPI00329E3765